MGLVGYDDRTRRCTDEYHSPEILDAFEYDVPPATAPPSHTRGGSDEVDHTLLKHTFKIVTTKRTLVLCAPSEEEEIQWLSAVRALIARRSDAGVVLGGRARHVGAEIVRNRSRPWADDGCRIGIGGWNEKQTRGATAQD